MPKSRYSEDKMLKILREADGTSVPKVAKKYGVSEQTIYAWRKRYTGMDVADVKRLRALESENAKLKKLLAERKAIEGPPPPRATILLLATYGIC